MTDQTKTTSELLKTLNEIRALEGKDPIAKWKRSRSDLETLLKTYDEEPEADPLAEDQPNLPLASDPQYADDDVLDVLSDEVAQINIPAHDWPLGVTFITGERLEEGMVEGWYKVDEAGRTGPYLTAEEAGMFGTETVPRVKSPRGAIGVMVMDLLQTDMPYKDIVKQVRDTYWDAKTTERSVASIAMDLRRDGVNVPARRKPAAIKQVVAAAQAAQPSTEVPEGLADQA